MWDAAWISPNVISVYCSQVAAQLIPGDISSSSSPSTDGYYSSKFINGSAARPRQLGAVTPKPGWVGGVEVSVLINTGEMGLVLFKIWNGIVVGATGKLWRHARADWWVLFVQMILVLSASITNSAAGPPGGCLRKLVLTLRQAIEATTVMTAANCCCTALHLSLTRSHFLFLSRPRSLSLSPTLSLPKCFAINASAYQDAEMQWNNRWFTRTLTGLNYWRHTGIHNFKANVYME